MKVIWTETAEKDLWQILAFLADDNPEFAFEMRLKFHNAADSLLDFPDKGRKGAVSGTRELIIFPSYIMVYRVVKPCIRILRLFHMSRNYMSASLI